MMVKPEKQRHAIKVAKAVLAANREERLDVSRRLLADLTRLASSSVKAARCGSKRR
jgi:hypothetical protein